MKHLTRVTRFIALVALTAMVWTCSDSGTDPGGQAASITVNPSAITFDALTDTRTITATVRDQDGNLIQSAPVSWNSDTPMVASVNASGVVTSVGNGTATVTASVGSVSRDIAVTVAQVANQVQVVSGSSQTGQVGQTLPDSLVAQVNDRLSQPIEGLVVNFTPAQDAGTVSPTGPTSASNGQVKTAWTLGTKAGAVLVSANPATGTGAGSFSATATAGAADSIAKFSGDNQSALKGNALVDSIAAIVTDQFGNGIAGHTVTFAVLTGGGSVSPTSAMTGANGRAKTRWTLGNTSGPQTMQASGTKAGGAPLDGSPVTFTATGADGQMFVNDGNNQTGLVSKGVNIPPSVKITDLSNNPIAGVQVTFAVATGGGSVTGAVAVSDANGIAEVGSWVLGSGTGSNTLTATATTGAVTNSPQTFNATGEPAQYNIVVRFLNPQPTDAQKAIFTQAAQRWQELIFGDVTNINFNQNADACLTGIGTLNETIDDLVIYAKIDSIDGPGQVLGSAGPCFIRTGGANDLIPLLGRMRFDSADVAVMSQSALTSVILHEMGHVIGVGTMWPAFNHLQNRSCDDMGSPISGQDTHHNGPQTIKAFDRVGGKTYTASAKVPAENGADGPPFALCPGSRDGHWRESVFDTELMTPFLDGGANPNSIVSLASLWDMGYKVAYANADLFTLVFPAPFAARGQGSAIDLSNDIWRGRMWGVDPAGRIVEVIEPGTAPRVRR